MKKRGTEEKLSIASRAIAAIGGGYGVATVCSILLVRTLPLSPSDAVMTGLLVSFFLYALAALWAFAARTATRAWAGLLLPILLFSACGWLVGP